MSFADVKNAVKKMKKGQTVGLVYDECGDGYSEDYITVEVVQFKRDDGCDEDDCKSCIDGVGDCHFSDDSETIICITVTGQQMEICYEESDYIKEVFMAKKGFLAKMKTLETDKVPKTKDRYVGVEIEFISILHAAELTMIMVDAGLEEFIQLKDDGSIDTDSDSGYEHSHEVCVLAKESQIARVVTKLMKVLKGNSAVNKSCGLHVHLDMRLRNPDVAYANLFKAQPFLYAMCPNTRRSNTYCKPEMEYQSFFEFKNPNGERYFGVNRDSYKKHKTIEVRLHSSTLQADKIINWVKLLIKIANQETTQVDKIEMCQDLRQLKRDIKLRGKLETYVVKRIKEFKAQHANSFAEIYGISA